MEKPINNLPTRIESTPGFVIQSNRLAQIVWVSLISVGCSVAYFAVQNWTWSAVEQSLIATLGIFLLCLWLIKKQRPQQATALFVVTLSVMACALLYFADGLHDEALIIFPGILLLACMFGSPRQFYLLLVALISFLAFVVVGHQQGWHVMPDKVQTNLSELLNVSVIIIGTGFFGFVLAGDLRKALIELNLSKRELLELNDQLESRVAQRTEQVESANRALHDSMEQLERAMNELVHAEKLASLGSMVAGISHELNTPIGNSLLAASSLERLFVTISEKVQAGNFKRSALEEFIKEGLEISALITRSTSRAADMVSSFKQVAVDQTSEQRRNFDLKDVIDDNLSAMLPNFKNKEIRINNTVPEGIECNSYPGPLGQILTNLVQNAIVHGFDERGYGNLTLIAENLPDHVMLSIHDDGIGMAQNVIAHVFDPFFTTRMGRGGSGLGLTISHRIATSILGGDLRVDSAPGIGTTFTLTLPKMAPFPI